jgi:hypothetical protein
MSARHDENCGTDLPRRMPIYDPGMNNGAGGIIKPDDPWAHRSTGMRCASCMRFAPTMNGFPVVFEADWCGDHKLDETKPR